MLSRIASLARVSATPLRRSLTVTRAAASDMMCYQCEQTRDGTGCTTVGVCGKTPETAALQDATVHALKGISSYAHRASQFGAKSDKVDAFVLDSLFATLTNVNFDPKRFQTMLNEAAVLKRDAQKMFETAAKAAGQTPQVPTNAAAQWQGLSPCSSIEQLEHDAKQWGLEERKKATHDDEKFALAELCMYGLKGLAAYAHHAKQLGRTSPAVNTFVHKALDQLAEPSSAGDMLGLALEIGKVNVDVMGMLDKAHTDRFGHPTPHAVRTEPIAGKCILVSGHDLNDLYNILQQTEGKGINVYTHGEMLPAHGYPGLRKFSHLAGNYGSAWQNQKFEFSDFPGPIIMTTNCLVEPLSYRKRLYTRGVTGWPGCTHIPADDYTPVIEDALKQEGFDENGPNKTITVGFGHNTVLSIADKVLSAVSTGDLKHVFFIGGCDGTEGERNYFRDVALGAPKDSIVLTAGCGKYRFNKHDFGTLQQSGLPRLLDVGQCNDAYGVVMIASGLAKALNCGINDLPLSLAVSWFEQKAVAVLLSLLHLGVKNIYLGPKLPAFVTPSALSLLQQNFGIRKTGDAKTDLKQMLKL
eukprot:TRINITY_DN5636_c0_g1_i1.p1 TRINITY_DN5636_c0_g1~~TRINITY_DN5636_c0_g1_i1.p1  ORF type:complete len:583 (+),score=142.15 TRINITY_DN5636_c0_g1_i1:107-1855(+)